MRLVRMSTLHTTFTVVRIRCVRQVSRLGDCKIPRVLKHMGNDHYTFFSAAGPTVHFQLIQLTLHDSTSVQ